MNILQPSNRIPSISQSNIHIVATRGPESLGREFIAPHRFSHVQDNLFRGGFPKERNYLFMKRLKLKTIISLIPKPPPDSLMNFVKANGIELVHMSVAKPKDNNLPLTPATALQCIYLFIDINKLPLYVHCLDGSVVTGAVVVCFRKLQLWAQPSAIIEYLRFKRDQVIGGEESEFFEQFNPEFDFQAYEKLPEWLWENGRLPKTYLQPGIGNSKTLTFKHPITLKLKNVSESLLIPDPESATPTSPAITVVPLVNVSMDTKEDEAIPFQANENPSLSNNPENNQIKESNSNGDVESEVSRMVEALNLEYHQTSSSHRSLNGAGAS